MANYVEVSRFEQLPVGSGSVVTLDGKDIALFNVDGNVYAMDNACLHHGSSLGTSQLEGKIVTCRAHGWRYDVTTGNVAHVPGYGVATYAVKVEGGKILVAADERATPA